MEQVFYSADHFFDGVVQLLEDEKTLAPLREAVKSAADWRSRLSAIRVLHQAYERLGRDDFEHCDPYDFGLHDYWTPIGWKLWQDIRGLGRLHMVPQFPVGPYFLDFANPKRKIGLEADGKQYHDAERDRQRDQRLWDEFGWKVYRVSGAECHRVRPSPWEFIREYREANAYRPDQHDIDQAAIDYFCGTSTGVCLALREIEYKHVDDAEFFDEMAMSLNEHRLADFPVGCV